MGRIRDADSIRLTEVEARAVRETVRRVRAVKGLSNEAIALELAWDIRRVTNALADARELHAPTAFALVRTVERMPANRKIWSQARRQGTDIEISKRLAALHASPWIVAYRARQGPPAVLVPQSEIEKLAHHLANEIARVTGVGSKKTTDVINALTGALRRDQSGMASSWELRAASIAYRFLESVESGKRRWLEPPQRNSEGRIVQRPVLQLSPSALVREAIRLTATDSIDSLPRPIRRSKAQ
jgi:hypothetical protein